jgi:UDP:flavonoid glycosyltransferase YjiC (YdhE family)
VGADRFLHLGIEELSHRGGGLPEHLSFVGTLPAFRPAGNRLPDWWADVESAETVVVVTQGTSPNQDFSRLIEPALEALADLPVLVVATTGREGRVRAVPANARVAAFIPFDDLLPHTDVLVTNGGFGGVQHALRLGTPVVLAGQDEDGLRGNAHVAATGAAIAIADERPDAMSIRKAVETVLTTADFRRNAERLAAEHAGLDALAAIARTVDELTGS